MSKHEHICPVEEHHHCGGCEHCHSEEQEESRLSLILLAVSAVLVFISFIPMNKVLFIILGIAAVGLSAYPIALEVWENIRNIKSVKRFSISETDLMLTAIIAACCLGEFREAAAVGILYRIGEMLEEKGVARSRRDIDAVSEIQQDFANLLLPDGTTKKIHAEEVEIGSEILVLPHERFPIDGKVVNGTSSADTSAITGESLPVDVSEGVIIRSGTVNGSGTVTVKTTALLGDSAASRIIKMVEEASERKSKTQKAITRFAEIYTPVVVIFAVLIAVVGSVISKNPAEWVRRALVFLVASCPCALVISIPLGFYSGLGAAAKNGIIVKGSAFAEAFAKARAIVFDKTGTLTTDTFEIEKIRPLNGFDEQQVLTLAAAAEHFSSHPIAKSIVDAAPEIDGTLLSDFTETAGSGVSVNFAGRRIICGSKNALKNEGIDTSGLADGEICVAVGTTPVGTILLRSKLRDGAAQMISDLRSQGIESTVMLTGDSEAAAKSTALDCGIDSCYSGLLPEEKLTKLEEIRGRFGKVVYIGDGINDAPVLTAADAGIAMGLGTQAANEAADIILTNNDLTRIAPAHRLFRKTIAVMRFNIIFSIAVKLIVLILGAAGLAPIWLAVFADVGVCLICVVVSSMIGISK